MNSKHFINLAFGMAFLLGACSSDNAPGTAAMGGGNRTRQ